MRAAAPTGRRIHRSLRQQPLRSARSSSSLPPLNLRWYWSQALTLCPHNHHYPLHPTTHTTHTTPPPPHHTRHFASRPSPTTQPRPPLTALRNFGIIAHIDAGKTTTTERLLYYANHTHQLGNIHTANTHTDFLPEERRRGITIKAAAVSVGWRGCRLSLVDTPGHVDFTQEVESALRVMDSAVLLCDAVKGVQAQTMTVYAQSQRYGLATIGYVNKMDRDGADMHKAQRMLADKTGKPVLPLQLPVYEREGEADSFIGVVDVIDQVELRWNVDEDGRTHTTTPITPTHPLHTPTLTARAALCEAIAEHDDAFLSLWLSAAEGGSIAAGEVRAALRRLCVGNVVIPLLCGSSLRNKGVQPLMDAIVHYAPSPADVTSVRVTVTGNRQQAGGQRKAAGGGRKGQQKGGVKREEEVVKAVGEGEERAVVVREDGPLLALAFKVTHDLTRTPLPLVLVRVYSGTLTQNTTLLNTTAHTRTTSLETVKEKPLRLLSVDGEHTEEVASIPAGHVGALVGLRHTIAGDTLIRAGDEHVTLPPIISPPPVFFASIHPSTAADDDRLTSALACMLREDASLSVSHSADTGQTLLQGQGALHLQVAYAALLEQWKVKAELGRVRVAYREGVVGGESCEEVMYVWEGVGGGGGGGGGVGGDVVLGVRLEAGEVGSGVVVDVKNAERMDTDDAITIMKDAITTSSTTSPHSYTTHPPPPPLPSPSTTSLPLTTDHTTTLHIALTTALQRGPLLGHPLLDVHLTLTAYYLTPATTAATLRYAAHRLTRQLLSVLQGRGCVCLLEPLMAVVVSVEKSDVGGVMEDVTGRRRGVILGVESAGGGGGGGGGGGREEVRCDVPLVELLDYADGLRSRTRGTGSYTMTLAHYAPVPAQLQAKLLANPYA